MSLQDWASSSWVNAAIGGFFLAGVFPAFVTPLVTRLQKQQRKINNYSGEELPADYWPVICRQIIIVAAFLTFAIRYCARSPHIHWAMTDLDAHEALNFPLYFALREFTNYCKSST
jgi:hypothetical protein